MLESEVGCQLAPDFPQQPAWNHLNPVWLKDWADPQSVNQCTTMFGMGVLLEAMPIRHTKPAIRRVSLADFVQSALRPLPVSDR